MNTATALKIGFSFVWMVVLTSNASHAEIGCPMEQELHPCLCKARPNGSILISCRKSSVKELAFIFAVIARRVPLVEEIMLENNDMTELSTDIFGMLAVRRLLLWHNGIERVDKGSFDRLSTHLKELHIREPRLNEIPAGLLNPLIHLKKLTIEHTPLRRLPSLIFCQSLETVHLDGTRLERIESRFLFHLSFLKMIQITNSFITEFENQSLSNLPMLETIDLSGNQLSTLQQEWWHQLPKLKVVNLQENNIFETKSLLGAINQFDHLEALYLDHNVIRTFDLTAERLPVLKYFTASYNNIESISNFPAAKWRTLRHLDLSFNRFVPKPSNLKRLPFVEHLNLAGNPIKTTDIRNILEELPGLRSLNLEQCGIDNISGQTFGLHHNLNNLSLKNNSIERIEPEAFRELTALTTLNLSHNNISGFPSFKSSNISSTDASAFITLNHLKKLESLDLSNNQLKDIDSPFLASLNQSLLTLNVSKNKIDSIVVFLSRAINFKALMSLDLSSNFLSADLDKRVCEHFPNLEQLIVSHNRIKNVELENCTKLRTLDLSHNEITSLSLFIFSSSHNNNLKLLNLNNNLLDSIPNLSKLESLETVSIEFNRIRHLQTRDLKSPLLRSLHLSHNRIKTLTTNEERLFSKSMYTNLRFLDMSYNAIEILPMYIFHNLTSLDILDLSFNHITQVQKDVFHPSTSRLQCLDLSNNKIDRLHFANDLNLENLRILKMQFNRIHDLTNFSIQKMPSLSELDLSSNAISFLHSSNNSEAGFGNSRTLFKLDLSNNYIEALFPKTFVSLPNLQILRLSRNRIERIEVGAFKDLMSLEVLELEENFVRRIDNNAFDGPTHLLGMLNLSHNSIERIEDAGINDLFSLEILDLSYNKIGVIESNSFRRLGRLLQLSIANNSICKISENSFQNQRKLQSLSLRNNRLQMIPESTIHSKDLQNLDVGGNRLRCDCHLKWILKVMESSFDTTFTSSSQQKNSNKFKENFSSNIVGHGATQNGWKIFPLSDFGNCLTELNRLLRFSLCNISTLPLRTNKNESCAPPEGLLPTLNISVISHTSLEQSVAPNNDNFGIVPVIYAAIRKPNNTADNELDNLLQNESKTKPVQVAPFKFGTSMLPALAGIGALSVGLFQVIKERKVKNNLTSFHLMQSNQNKNYYGEGQEHTDLTEEYSVANLPELIGQHYRANGFFGVSKKAGKHFFSAETQNPANKKIAKNHANNILTSDPDMLNAHIEEKAKKANVNRDYSGAHQFAKEEWIPLFETNQPELKYKSSRNSRSNTVSSKVAVIQAKTTAQNSLSSFLSSYQFSSSREKARLSQL